MSVFARVFAWFAEEFVVKALANSRRFQQLALKIDSTIASNKSIIDEKVIKTGKTVMNENLSKAKTFTDTFANEIKKEMNKKA